MTKQKQLSLTIGIPAHNEEKNIISLLDSIVSQSGDSFTIDTIIVACDGCTDATAIKVRAYQNGCAHHIVVIDDGKRVGKALRLNQIYTQNTSDALLTMDADVLFSSTRDLEILCQSMLSNPYALVVGPRYVPVPTDTFVGQCAVYSYLSFEDSIFKYAEGQNIFALMGCCSLIRASLVKKIIFPVGTISDQNYLYLSAMAAHTKAFILEKNAHVLFKTVTTLRDWWILSARSVRGDRDDVLSRFGEDVRLQYTMPRKLYFMSLTKFLFKSPIYTFGAIVLNILIRLLPYKTAITKPGIWQTTSSSKTIV